jgi:dipeptidyl-peptidase-3
MMKYQNEGVHFDYVEERFADLQLLRYRLEGFEQLSLCQKELVYYLSKATLYGRDITFDQFGKYNLRIRKLLEAVYTDSAVDHETADFKAMEIYLKRLWFSNGIYHHYGCDKFEPGFSQAWLKQVVSQIEVGRLPLKSDESVSQLTEELFPVIFDKTVLPKRVNKADGDDLVVTSACNFYDGVTQVEAEAYYQQKKDAAADDKQPV